MVKRRTVRIVGAWLAVGILAGGLVSAAAEGPVSEAHRAAVATLRKAIAESYSYRDLRGVDWDSLFREHGPRLERSASPAAFAQEALALLAHAQDPHLWLTAGGPRLDSFARKYTCNYNIETLARRVPGWGGRGRWVRAGRFDDGTGYVLIKTWDPPVRGDLHVAFKAVEDAAAVGRLIVDVRPNGGGAEALAAEFAGGFVDQPVAYAMHAKVLPGAPGGFAEPVRRVLSPTAGRPRFRGRVAVLVGPENLSSCEAFLLMMRQVPGAKLVGETSGGSSGNPQPHDLGNGVTAFVPSWKAMDARGVCFEGKGVAPDLPVQATPEQLQNGDPILDAALRYVRTGEASGAGQRDPSVR